MGDSSGAQTSKLHVVVYSHGFGNRMDDRGLFADIAASLPNAEHILFDYNLVDHEANTLTVAPLGDQARQLVDVLFEVRKNFPDAIIDIIAHSQGCVGVAIAAPGGIRQVIFLAPPTSLDRERSMRRFAERAGSHIDPTGISRLARRDGSTTLVPPEFWHGLDDYRDTMSLYRRLAELTNLILIQALNDEVLGITHLIGLCPPAKKLIELATNHDFTSHGRERVIRAIQRELGYQTVSQPARP